MTDTSAEQRHPLLDFIDNLKVVGMHDPDMEVLFKMATYYPLQMQSSLGSPQCCAALYEIVKTLPSSTTLNEIQHQLNISISKPISLEHPEILAAIDLAQRKAIMIKLIRLPTAGDHSKVKYAIQSKMQAYQMVANANIDGLIKCEVSRVEVKHEKGLYIAQSEWGVIKMHHYVSSLAKFPQFSENLLKENFHHILKALNQLHLLGFVHMDVKPDNVFVDQNLNWHLGDFGSSCKIGDPVIGFTPVMNPWMVPKTAIPSIDLVQLCVTVAIEVNKENWQKKLCRSDKCVQNSLIHQQLHKIVDLEFQKEVITLFDQHLNLMRLHYASVGSHTCLVRYKDTFVW